jgi:CheY-like chemotaxis protein
MDQRMVRIVVAERSPDVGHLITTILERRGYRVASAVSSSEAAGLVERLDPDLLVTDAELEGPDAGFGLLQRLRQSPTMARLGVVVCIGGPTADGYYPAMPTHARERHIAKPFTASELLACVRSLLDERA